MIFTSFTSEKEKKLCIEKRSEKERGNEHFRLGWIEKRRERKKNLNFPQEKKYREEKKLKI